MKVLLVVSNIITAVTSEVDTSYYQQISGDDCHRRVGLEVDLECGIIHRLYTQSEIDLLLPNSSLTVINFPPGYCLLPGYIDCHVHLTIPTDNYQMQFLQTSSASNALTGLKNAQGLLHAGFTTLRSAGDADLFFPTVAIAKSIDRGEHVGPRIVGAGHYISVTGGGGDINSIAPDKCLCCPSDGLIADGKDAMLAAVRKEIKFGSDWIKILVTGAFMTSSTNAKDSPENTHFSIDELEICVQEAKRRRVPVMAHAHGADGIIMAAQSGVRSIEHASFIDQNGINACLKMGTWIVPTFLVGSYFEVNGSDSGAQDRMIEIQRRTNSRYYECISNAVKAGVKVALGSDFVGWDPAITAREFRHMVELGSMTNMQSIYAGTGSAADLLEMDKVGRIAPGKIADLVIVRGDPLVDISILESGVEFVMKGGLIVRDDLSIANDSSLRFMNISRQWYRPNYKLEETNICGDCVEQI